MFSVFSDHRFLHEDTRPTPSYYAFRNGYMPTYSDAEVRKFDNGSRVQTFPVSQPEPMEQDRTPQAEAMEQDIAAFPEPHWLQNQCFVDALMGLEVYVIVRHIAHCKEFVGPSQCPVSLTNWTPENWELGLPRPIIIHHRPDRKKKVLGMKYVIKPADIPSLDESFSRTDGLGTLGVRGLYLVIRGSHIGKLVRRVIHIEDPGLYIFPRMKAQVVQLVYSRKKVVSEIHLDEPFITVHRDDILIVEETAAFHQLGNKGMEDKRKIAEDELKKEKQVAAAAATAAAQGL